MPVRPTLFAGLAALATTLPAMAEITVEDAYARSASPMAKTGAAFMILRNDGEADDRLVSARTGAAAVTELHTHIDMGDGVMKMTEVEEGFAVPAGGTHVLQRGGDHVMMMGLKAPFVDGESVTVTLVFEEAGEMVVEIPIDLTRKPGDMPMDGGS
ncbi:copper chaperone PCu(A)C [Psychromarinibacter sp. C21-152]|uniref:Copper chaperone PCu(A)C n=1 Tax=Psychromarinibacter sediminicola TaxID=3033385 RepID=A0AAE3NTM4_9RHOB|nr:copper chaperone PCu(A)C [Psychromarinibacter sediminicola]MDF0603328.1 copper chaperone PCu(A)C [Psychromarinibacter sediminicola]